MRNIPRCIAFSPTLLSKIDGYATMRTVRAKRLGIKLKPMNRSQAVRALILIGLEKERNNDSRRTNSTLETLPTRL